MVNETNVRFDPQDEGEFVPGTNYEVKPVQGPRPARDFKKVLGKTGREGKDEKEEYTPKKTPSKVFSEDEGGDASGEEIALLPKKDDLENATDAGIVSPFNLAKPKKSRAAHADVVEKTQSVGKPKHAESPAALFSRMSSKEGVKDTRAELAAAAVGAEESAEKTQNDKFTTRYSQEQPDLSSVNPLAYSSVVNVQAPQNTAKIEKPVGVSQAIQDLYAQLVKQLYTVTKGEGKTDTVLVLQYPPQFKDARVIVSSYETARGQLNISFENLTQEGQRILDMDVNRRSLTDALQKKGYNIQILVTTTTVSDAVPILPEEARSSQQDDQNQQQASDQQQGRRRRNPDEATG